VPELLRQAVGHLGAKPNSNALVIRATSADRQLARSGNAPARSFSQHHVLSAVVDKLMSETLAGVGNPSRAYVQL